MKTRAAVAFEAGKPLQIEMLDLEGPRAGEVLLRNVATGVCHTDAFTLSGEDPEGIFPAVLGHEGGAIVEEVGEGVTSVAVGDHVIPLYTPECRECNFCTSGKTNLCQAIRATQGQGLMPDGTSRFSLGGKTVFHYMGTSTFSEYTLAEYKKVVAEPMAPVEIGSPPAREYPEGQAERVDRIMTFSPGKARGRLVGGNLSLVSPLVGTPYLPDFEGAILFLEDVNEAFYRLDRMLTHLLLGNLALILTPMTKIVHCVLGPLTQLLSEVAWHFPADSGRRVAAVLGKENEPI
mgnify:CR=1 FL=1